MSNLKEQLFLKIYIIRLSKILRQLYASYETYVQWTHVKESWFGYIKNGQNSKLE